MITRPRPTRPYTAPFETPLMTLSRNSSIVARPSSPDAHGVLLGLDLRRRGEVALGDERAVLDDHPLELRSPEMLVRAVGQRRQHAGLDRSGLLERGVDGVGRDVALDRLHDL